jgi:HKD family nuclease
MKITFLGQGFEENSINAVGNHLMNFLSLNGFDSFLGISAFASEAGIFGLSGYLQGASENFQSLTLIVGIDLEGTSKEALEEILALNIDSYIFYQKEQPIFHPKIYLFEGPKDVKLIIGSSNLTTRGLFCNVESSLLIEFETTDKEGITLLSELKSYYKTLFDFSDPNLFKISNEIIAKFYLEGIIPDEVTRGRNFSKKITQLSIPTTTVTNTLIVPRRAMSRVPSTFPSKRKRIAVPAITPVAPRISTIPQITIPIVQSQQPLVLVWQKLSLSKSDAQVVPSGTNGTGNLKLSQARFKVNSTVIDQITYFRYQVFNSLTWAKTKPNRNSYEEAICSFQITILGTSIGMFPLKISHDKLRIADQGNTPTWLHWGNFSPILQQTNLAGRTLNLFQSNQSFFIEIV